MSTRLQIIMEEEDVKRFRRCAEREGLTLSEWSRRALRRAQLQAGGPSAKKKLRALEEALQCHHPAGEMEQILAEIERGRDLR